MEHTERILFELEVGIIVAMSILTTLVAPPFLKTLFSGRVPVEPRQPGEPRTPDAEGIGE